ncbi:DUF2846 domain-containing protein [Sphingopyxis macrogoltabida]|uniref:DUF2846 domain-containing protein n=1 Tax=Sphingopyxis macrogoltabida TaxID=33050 RepID=A0AAC9AVJ7_SPHMC|nr:DUF2846 domain-containing protein [Sphingopyxis macrogoltabida]ALJ12603.1 hypothetical protein LH19_06965 [Sphingopyxis macrogoltabida]AMU89926.1 hypothetical protein ATM17_12855 [Sphingopyxis macrogoltabida]
MRYILAASLALASVTAAAQEQPGKIIFYRPGAMVGLAVACPIRYEGKEIVELGRNKYAEWEVPPGRYIFMNKTAGLEVTVAPGETRYVRCAIKMGFMTGRADLQISDRASFEAKAGEFERKEVSPVVAGSKP